MHSKDIVEKDTSHVSYSCSALELELLTAVNQLREVPCVCYCCFGIGLGN